ncbi:hypothetical protein DCAR_0624306 [Daucus carota subsp. sativus]|uniref:Uncharacterized protein n=1 Tax=Daucus carota subsp. sativus TaxID=79200 RepID=A0A164VRN3_DAUCS|nr:hypothetical protein DCAR_0624306 [Daucus carota subsp. sativus]
MVFKCILLMYYKNSGGHNYRRQFRNILFDTGHLSITNRAITIFHTIERFAIINFFWQHGVDVNASDHTGQTALHWSAVQGAVQVAEILLQEGASVGAADMYGYQQEVFLANFRHGMDVLDREKWRYISDCEMDELLEGAVEDSFVGSLGPERSLFANELPLLKSLLARCHVSAAIYFYV